MPFTVSHQDGQDPGGAQEWAGNESRVDQKKERGADHTNPEPDGPLHDGAECHDGARDEQLDAAHRRAP